MNNTVNGKGAFDISVRNIIDIIFRYKRVIIITFVICMTTGFLVTQFMTPIYDANVKMLVRGQNVIESETYAPFMGGVQLTQVEIVKSFPVLKRAVITLGLHQRPLDYEKNFCSKAKGYYVDYAVKKIEKKLNEIPADKKEESRIKGAVADLRGRLSVNMVPGTDIFVINVKAFTPDEAIATANIISRSYTLFDQIQQLAEVKLKYGEAHPTVIQLIDNINTVTNNLSGNELPDIDAIGTASVKIIEQATSTLEPVGKPRKIILAVALLLSLLISFVISLALGLLDTTIKKPKDIIEHLGITCIGSIPMKQRKESYLVTDKSPDTGYYRFYEKLTEDLAAVLKQKGLKTIIITSPAAGSNHMYIVPNLGYFFSRVMDLKVLLVDVNYNKPGFQKVFNLKDLKGIDAGINPAAAGEHVKKLEGGVDIIPAAEADEKTAALLKKIGFKSFIAARGGEYDIILLDATSKSSLKDVSFLSEYYDCMAIVIDEGKVNWQMLKNSLERLDHKNAVIIGGILNNRTFPVPEFIFKYLKYSID